MEESPKISIVLPTRNGRRYIDSAITSMVEQSYPSWELILVDDASSDDTPARLQWWATQDPRIQCVLLKENRTLPGALNVGFQRARGQFHAWTSDDNSYLPEALATMLQVLESDPAIDVVYADLISVNQHGRVLGASVTGSVNDMWRKNQIGACFLYRSEVFTTLGGYDEALFGAEDYDFWLRAMLKFRFEHISQTLYNYRRHSGSLTDQKHRLVTANVEKAIRRWLPLVNWADEETRRLAYTEWGIRCLMAGNMEEVFEPWLHNASWVDPSLRQRIETDIYKRASRLARQAVCTRRWKEVERFRQYALRVKDDPEVARILSEKFYPRWVYHFKDWLLKTSENVFTTVTGNR